jgi:hypothetical protein
MENKDFCRSGYPLMQAYGELNSGMINYYEDL